MGGGRLRGLRPHWVKILPHYNIVTADLPGVLNVSFMRIFNFKENLVFPIEKCLCLMYYPGIRYGYSALLFNLVTFCYLSSGHFRRSKPKENFKILALKVVSVVYTKIQL